MVDTNRRHTSAESDCTESREKTNTALPFEASGDHGRGDNLIRIRNLSKSYTNNTSQSAKSHFSILKSVDFDLTVGETVAIVGASGIGKSTLLHIMGALDRPDSGIFLFRGQDVFSFDNSQLASFRNTSVGFIFQFHYLLAEFSALENAMLPMLIQGIDKAMAKETAEEILVRVGLKERLSFRVTKLSGGEQQRVALARAIVLKPALLLADEPTGNLDRQNSEQVHQLLMELNHEFGMTMVIVTHNATLASYMSRRVTIINGKLTKPI
ncbi:ABC transporter ATP-binding protein [Desulfococcaceae bacterium HSG9]|nr:ABC transporter ATP-binding protein [Desulfococcaceae bacterium HSG9]